MKAQTQIAFVLERTDEAGVYSVVASIANNDGTLPYPEMQMLQRAIAEQLRATPGIQRFGIVEANVTLDDVLLSPEQEDTIQWDLTPSDLAKQVEVHAVAHYNDGWDVLVETKTLKEIEADLVREEIHTLPAAIEYYSHLVAHWAEGCADAKNSIF